MQWSEVVKPPSAKMLRQFSGLWLIFFLALAGLRWYGGRADQWTALMAGVAVVGGVIGMAWPAFMRPIYTGWMIAAFPIGWTVSRVVLGGVFFVVITPLAWVFRLLGRDELRLRRNADRQSHWRERPSAAAASSYLRQS